MSFRVRNTNPLKSEVSSNIASIASLNQTTDNHSSALGILGISSTAAVTQQPYLSSENFNPTHPDPQGQTNALDNIYASLAQINTALGLLGHPNSGYPPIVPGRTITFNNMTASQNLDLYLTVGGTNPKPITQLTTLTAGGAPYVWAISDTLYNFQGNFTTMPAGVAPPQYNAGPTLAEFGLNQVWKGATPELRDTFDISTVPPGIGTCCNNGPRSAAVQASLNAGFTQQQAYNYNVGIQIMPPVGGGIILPQAVNVTCTDTNGDCAQSIGFPNDTANPKQQTRDALGNYVVNFLDPVVSLP